MYDEIVWASNMKALMCGGELAYGARMLLRIFYLMVYLGVQPCLYRTPLLLFMLGFLGLSKFGVRQLPFLGYAAAPPTP